MEEREIGVVTDYYRRIGVAGVHLGAPIHRGDRIHIRGHTTDLDQDATSIEIDHRQVDEADAGQSVGIRVRDRVRRGDHVYLVVG